MSTTVPQNMKGMKIAGRHTPTRNSLRHSRMIVVNNKNHDSKSSKINKIMLSIYIMHVIPHRYPRYVFYAHSEFKSFTSTADFATGNWPADRWSRNLNIFFDTECLYTDKSVPKWLISKLHPIFNCPF